MFDEWLATAVGEGAAAEQQVEVPGRPAEFADADAVKYRSQFEDPRDPDDDIAVLELRGLYAHAEVEATGERLDGDWMAEHDTYFEPLRVPFRPSDRNELVVTCRAPGDRFGGIHDTDLVPDGDGVPGIWWGATLESHALPTIDSISVTPEMTEEGVRFDVETTVISDEPLSDRITYSLRPEGELNTRGMMERESIETEQAGKTTVGHTLAVRDPALWWPRELGRQHRYTLRAKLGDDEHSATTGVCDVRFEGGQLRINGEPLHIRGVNLLTAEPMDVERAQELNANLVRAHAHVLPEELYEACDRAGVLVWQDLPLTGPGAFDTQRGKALARALGQHCRAHPSVAAYSVHDDPVESFADGLGGGFFDGLRLRWRAWRSDYNPEPAEAVAGALPDGRPVFPVIGGPGVGADAASYYPGWDYGQATAIKKLLERYPADLLAEYGAGSVLEGSSGEAAGFDAAKHDARVSGECEDSQAYQAAVLQSITESLRASGTGAVAFSLRDTDSAGMGVYANDGTPKTGKETLARSFAPLQAFLTDPSPGASRIVVVNDTPSGHSLTVEWAAGEAGESMPVDIGAQDRWTSDSVSIPGDAEAASLTLSVDEHVIENQYDL